MKSDHGEQVREQMEPAEHAMRVLVWAAIAVLFVMAVAGCSRGRRSAVRERGADRETPAPGGSSEAQAELNWPRFRGPHGGVASADYDTPAQWDGTTGKGVLWRTPIPLPGNSSPII